MVFLKTVTSSFFFFKKKFPKFSTHNSNGLQVNGDSKVKQVLFDTNLTKRFSTILSMHQPMHMLGSNTLGTFPREVQVRLPGNYSQGKA